MTNRVARFAFLAIALLLGAATLVAQTPYGNMVGTVLDPQGAAVVGADITAKDDATGAEFHAKSGPDGHFAINALSPGLYTVTITMQGFKKGVYRAVKIITADTYDLSVMLEIGEVGVTVVVEAGQEVLETTSATVGSVISGKAITQLPFTSRQVLELAILMPGASTTGRTRQTSFNGLPKGSLNITIDGINAQDNLLKSNDGFFTIIQPRVDAIEEFSITTAAAGAEQNAEGAVQMRFETKRGGNDYHGGVWEYLRNSYLNANYWYSNRDGLPRQVQKLNQYGYKIGGPIIKQKLFFFTDFDFYTSPQSRSFTRTILADATVGGKLTYPIPCAPGSVDAAGVACAVTSNTPNAWTTCTTTDPRAGGNACTADLAAFTSANGIPFVFDTLTSGYLTSVNGVRNPATGAVILPVDKGTPWLDTTSFNVPGSGSRRFPDFRFDYQATKSHQITAVYHYQHFLSNPDFLNNAVITFPVSPFNGQQGSQISNRNQIVAAWRWTIGNNKSNELRFGIQSSLVSFFPDESSSFYPTVSTNLGKPNARPVFSGSLGGITQPFLTYNQQGRNTPVGQLIDNFTWTKGTHNFAFGATWTEIRFHGFLNGGRKVQTANIGLASSDPQTGKFSATNFPGSSTTSRNALGALYAALTGRVSSYSGTISVDPTTQKYVSGASNLQATRQREFGFYGSDSWRFRPSLTVTAGVRWEYQGVPTDDLNETFSAVAGYAGVWGISGFNNFFKPGTLSGSVTSFQLNGSRPWYNNEYNNFAPNIGLAWQPKAEHGLLHGILGGQGKTVLRAGYSISYTREGVNNFLSIAPSNPGIDGSIFANPVAIPAAPTGSPAFTCATAPPNASGQFYAGCVTLSGVVSGQLQTLNTSPTTFPATGTVPIVPFSGQSVNAFDPNLRTPLVHSWSVGWQREITNDMVVEVRYVANHSVGLWRQDNLNEVNIFQGSNPDGTGPGSFLQEFINAQSNLTICNADATCKATPSFANKGLPGQVALPIFTAAFGSSTSSNFTSSNFVPNVQQGYAGTVANFLAIGNNGAFLCNMAGSAALNVTGFACPASAPGTGLFPVNFFVANPQATGTPNPQATGAFRFFNGSQSTYNALQIEVRRRPSKGLQFNGNYTYSKSLTNYFGDSSVSFVGFTAIRNPGNDKGPSPWDLRHAFKLQTIYELPFGPGRKWSSGNGLLNKLIEHWEISGIGRLQSGRVFLLGSGGTCAPVIGPSGNSSVCSTVNQNDPGVILKGLTQSQLGDLLGIRKTPGGTVFDFPASLIGSDGKSNPAFIAPCNTPGKLCSRVFLHGPSFFRADISVLKRTYISEKVNFEIRGEALNAFNNINFFFPGDETTSVPTVAVTGSTFGKVTNAFRDANTTDDNGGRILQIVFRINF